MGGADTLNVLGKQARHAAEVFQEEGVRSLLAKTFQAPGLIFQSALCRHHLSDLRPEASIDEVLDFVFGHHYIAPLQLRSELRRMLECVRNMSPATVVEIGTANGGTLLSLCRVAAPNAKIVSIDMPGGGFGGGYSAWRIPLYKAFAHHSQDIFLIRKDSHSLTTLNELKTILAGNVVDFLFIDGDHSPEGVYRDFELYSPLVKKGGILGFHDIAPLSPSPDYGSRQLWTNLRLRYESKEIIEDPNQKGFGIGLLHI